MKIGIITQPLRTNYGGILQNYALQVILRRRGHLVTTLQRDRFIKVHYPRYLLTLLKRIVLKILGKYSGTILKEKKYNDDYPIFTKHTMGFVNEKISIREIKDFNLEISKHDFDIFIVGSDQVWRPAYNNLDNTFLAFTNDWNVKRISYAASFGTDEWEYSKEQTKKCACLIKSFDGISVREDSAVTLCRNNFNVEAKYVLDPTFLLDKKDYESLIKNINSIPTKGELFVHYLDKTDDKLSIVSSLCKKMDWIEFSVNCQIDEHMVDAPLELRIQPPIEQWLRGFLEAKYVITDSFHGMVFSIIFNKPFLVYANNQRGTTRFISLLKILGLENRIVTHSSEFNEELLTPINYKLVNLKLNEWRQTSYDFLYQYI